MKLSTQKLPVYAVWVASLCVAATTLHTVIHEIVGHLGLAWLFGADLQGFEAHPFAGGGKAYYQFDGSVDSFPRILATSGGIAINLILGAISLLLAMKYRNSKQRELAVITWIFGALGVLGALKYIALGSYYGTGDPALALLHTQYWPPTRAQTWWLWGPALLLIGIVGWWILRLGFSIQDLWWPKVGYWTRIAIAVVACGTGVLVHAVGRPLTSSGSGRFYRADSIVMHEKYEERSSLEQEAAARIREQFPELSRKELGPHLRKAYLAIEDKIVADSPKPWPLGPFVFLNLGIGGLIASRGCRQEVTEVGAVLSKAHIIGALAVSACLVTLFGLHPIWMF